MEGGREGGREGGEGRGGEGRGGREGGRERERERHTCATGLCTEEHAAAGAAAAETTDCLRLTQRCGSPNGVNPSRRATPRLLWQ